MNCFAHGRPFLDDPYFLVGTSVPDWLILVDRKVRVREKHAVELFDDTDTRVQAVARGIAQHHRDDAWFHNTRAFVELNLQLAIELRERLGADDGFRPSFLAHITIEMLLDAHLTTQHPGLLDQYYQQLATVDPELVQTVVNRISAKSTDRLASAIPMILQDAYVYDYLDNERLLVRLNRILRRVDMPLLPEVTIEWIASARKKVASRQRELLVGHFEKARVA